MKLRATYDFTSFEPRPRRLSAGSFLGARGDFLDAVTARNNRLILAAQRRPAGGGGALVRAAGENFAREGVKMVIFL